MSDHSSFSDRWTTEHRLSAETRGGEDARPQRTTRVSIPKAASVVDYYDDGELGLQIAVEALDELEALKKSQAEFGEVIVALADGLIAIQRTVLDGQKHLTAKLHALRPIEKEKAPPVDRLLSLENLLAGLGVIVNKLDRLQAAVDKRDSATSVITFDSNGRPSKIRRSDGTEVVIERDPNKRQIRFRAL